MYGSKQHLDQVFPHRKVVTAATLFCMYAAEVLGGYALSVF